MMTSQLFSFKLSWKQTALLLLVATYLGINFFRVGGNAVVINLNNFIVTPLALGVTVLALMLWHRIAVGNRNRLLWSGLTIGWALWTIAEVWWAVTSLMGQEVPYPSWADVLWLVGYIPMYVALRSRIRSLPKMGNTGQKIGIWVVGLVTLGFTIPFIFVPTLQNSDPSALPESITSILYPLADIILLLLVQRLFFTYQQGMYGRAWFWLALGFIFFAVGDLVFVYANSNNIYYPDQQVNLLSTFGVDIPYNLSYLWMLIGLFDMRSLQSRHHTFAAVDAPIILVPNTHLLVFTKGDDTVLDAGQNYSRLFAQDYVKGRSLADVLMMSPEESDTLLQEIRAKNILQERTFSLNTRYGRKPVLISGIAVFNPKREYSGAILLLRLLIENYTADELLTDYEKAMIRSLLEKTGTEHKRQSEIKHLLANYYESFLRAFYNRSFTEGGGVLADAYVSELQSVCRQHEWSINIHADTLLDIQDATLSETQHALPILFETARQFVINIVDLASADRIIRDTGARFDESTLRNIDFCAVAIADFY